MSGPNADEFLSLIPAKLPTKRPVELPPQIRRPLCVVGLRGMVTSFCDDEGSVAFYTGLGDRNGAGSIVFEWCDDAQAYRVRQ